MCIVHSTLCTCFVIWQIGEQMPFFFCGFVFLVKKNQISVGLWFEYRPWYLHGVGNVRNGESLTSTELIWKSNLGVGCLLLTLLSLMHFECFWNGSGQTSSFFLSSHLKWLMEHFRTYSSGYHTGSWWEGPRSEEWWSHVWTAKMFRRCDIIARAYTALMFVFISAFTVWPLLVSVLEVML